MARLPTLPPRIAAASFHTARVPDKVATPFYQSVEWRDLQAAVMQERGRACQKCGNASGRLYVDHVVELRDGGAALDRTNLQVLCSRCHGIKTMREREKRLSMRHTRA